MMLWTLQDKAWLDNLQTNGIIYGDPDLSFKDRHEGFEEAYAWMVRQMGERLPDASGNLPVWAWTHKVDLRKAAWWFPKGQTLHRVSLEVPEHSVLVSCYELWHDVLNGFATIFREEETWMWDLPKEDPRVAASWEWVFDREGFLNHPDFDTAWHGPLSLDEWQQACVDGVRLEWVTKIEPFKGRGTFSGMGPYNE